MYSDASLLKVLGLRAVLPWLMSLYWLCLDMSGVRVLAYTFINGRWGSGSPFSVDRKFCCAALGGILLLELEIMRPWPGALPCSLLLLL